MHISISVSNLLPVSELTGSRTGKEGPPRRVITKGGYCLGEGPLDVRGRSGGGGKEG